MIETIDREILVNTMRKCGIPGEPFETVNRDGVKACVNINFYLFAQVTLFFNVLGQDAGFLAGRGDTKVDTDKLQEFASAASVLVSPGEFLVYFAGWTLS